MVFRRILSVSLKSFNEVVNREASVASLDDQHFHHVFQTFCLDADLPSRPNVPLPLTVSTMPSRSRSLYALATVFGLTASLTASSRTVGNWSPGCRVPRATPFLTSWMIWRYTGTPSYGLSLIHISEPTRLGMISY